MRTKALINGVNQDVLLIRPCLGVYCNRHSECVHYVCFEGSIIPSQSWWGRCPHCDGLPTKFLDKNFVGPLPKSVYLE